MGVIARLNGGGLRSCLFSKNIYIYIYIYIYSQMTPNRWEVFTVLLLRHISTCSNPAAKVQCWSLTAERFNPFVDRSEPPARVAVCRTTHTQALRTFVPVDITFDISPLSIFLGNSSSLLLLLLVGAESPSIEHRFEAAVSKVLESEELEELVEDDLPSHREYQGCRCPHQYF